MGNLDAPPRTAELWAAIRDRIATARMATILGGAGRALLEGDYTVPPWGEKEPGGRVVVVPTLPLGGLGAVWQKGDTMPVGFLIRTDFNNHRAAGYNIAIGMEAAQREAFDRLEGWTPAANTFERVMVAFPIHLVRPWQPRPLMDPPTGIPYLSSEYRLHVADAP